MSGEVIEVNAEPCCAIPRTSTLIRIRADGLLKVRVKTLRDYEEMLPFEAYADLTRRLQRYDEWTKERRMT